MKTLFCLLATAGLLWGLLSLLPSHGTNPYDKAVSTAFLATEGKPPSDDLDITLPSRTVFDLTRFAVVARKTIYYQHLDQWWSGAAMIVLSCALFWATLTPKRSKVAG